MSDTAGETVPTTGSDRDREFHIVGIGASAGGLEALERFFEAMPANTGMAFVVVQHFSPEIKSHMRQLLARRTSLPIQCAENGMEVKPDSIYLIPPKMEMVFSNGKLLLTEKSPERTLSRPIDQFLKSLAGDAGRYAIGVVLSGSGSDGSRGILDVHEAGGLVVAQDEQSAEFDGMPMNARATGVVDVVLPPAAIAGVLVQHVRNSFSPHALAGQHLTQTATEIERVVQLLHVKHGLDFSQYKTSTVGRRLRRRINLSNAATFDDYLVRLETDLLERNALYKDLLIGVTKFFRDPEAFESLAQRLFPGMLRRAGGNQPLRVWVAGCASGEEAYSIAMLLDEQLRAQGSRRDVKIFATDVHHDSLEAAAKGIFPAEALTELSEERRSRYFRQKRDGYQVSRELRRHVVFAPHNVINDAPFTHLDLVSCRNLLIYLQPAAQRKVLSLFHFALRADGALFLGLSESPGALIDELQVVDKRWRIYTKRRGIRIPLTPVTMSTENLRRMPMIPPANEPPRQADHALLNTYDRLLDQKIPPSILINEAHEILHVFAGASRYLRIPSGRPTNRLMEVVVVPLKASLNGALQHASRIQSTVRYTGIRIHADGRQETVTLTVEPIHVPQDNVTSFLVGIETEDEPTASADDETTVDMSVMTKEKMAAFESELRYAQENLQATVEELEASNEELATSNEEIQSANEELHSVNEELHTINAEHQRRLEELTLANNDMDNLLATTRVGVIFLDEELHIRRFTPEISRLFNLVPQDVGRSIEGFAHHLVYDSLIADLKDVFETQHEKEIHVEDRQGTPFLLRMLPYRSGDNVRGIVLTLIDVGTLRRAEADLERFKYMTESAADMHALINAEGYFVYANPAMCAAVGYTREELSRRTVSDIDAVYDPERFREVFRQAESQNIPRFESELHAKDGSLMPVEISVSSVVFEKERLLYASLRNIAERRRTEYQMRLQQMAIQSVHSGILITDAQADDCPITYANPAFCEMTGYSADEVIGRNCRFLQGPDTDQNTVRITHDAIENAEPCRVTLLNYRKDGSTFWNDLRITPVRDENGQLTNFAGVQNDITARVESEARANRNAERIQAILDSTAEGIYGINRRGILTFCNPSALRMLGYDKEEDIIGKHMHRLIHHTKSDGSPYDEVDCPIYRAAREHTSIHVDNEVFWRSDGTSFPVEYISSPKLHDGKSHGAVVSFQDITSRLLLTSRLEQMGKLVDSSHDAIIIWQLDGKIISWNQGASMLYGFSEEEAVGQIAHHLLSTIHPVHWDEICQSLQETGRWAGTLEHTTKTGESITASTRHQLLTGLDGEPQVLEINRDITEQMEIQKELERAHKIARAASEAKSAFLANVSHELRTPMTAVLGFADMLKMELDDPRLIEKVDTIKRNGKYLLSLLNDILDLSKIEAGRMDVEREAIDVRSVIEDVRVLMNVRSQQVGIPLIFDWKSEVPRRVTADRVRVRQILVNLIGNALKFTEKGEVRVTVELRRDNQPPTLDIVVSDTGIGIPPEQQQELFQPFTSASHQTARRFGGTGLGLSISKRLADAMGGSIAVQSESGVGSQFTLSLPVSDKQLQKLVTVAPTSDAPDAKKATSKTMPTINARILLADDRRDVWRVIKFFLEKCGAEVTIAENGQQAVDAVEKAIAGRCPFDLILMDMQMPVMSGREAVAHLRQQGVRVPIVALTADAMEGQRQECIELGCDEYFPKPVDGAKLTRLVASLLT